ncbi:hypothetical protein BAUCODRAFT_470558 [Baudoinia panamericana UAMH 10762]|uniref:Uncharacterized protein n=1 Tax=Baudoinia panamericana (strain UAMH 10762) TaxID=717646 RepID=M2NAZ6_BAUPA|nr:uncharacterized protein BAUCODRAFT_470558 [Baudoinia panamericana UAMH 10762]EMC96324.1 hypothetical protein BAUCODRAFT_470558 [Baudoinia panamericana UAMH 10762]
MFLYCGANAVTAVRSGSIGWSGQPCYADLTGDVCKQQCRGGAAGESADVPGQVHASELCLFVGPHLPSLHHHALSEHPQIICHASCRELERRRTRC